jgi:glutamate 5-kinase
MGNTMSTPESAATTPLLVVKLGSSSVTQNSGPDISILADALDQAVEAMGKGWQVILVSSGAQSVGRAVLDQGGRRGISPKLAAAFGQPILMEFYRSESARRGSEVCQVLIGESDLRSQARMTAIAAVLRESLAAGIIPIVNGNDPTDDGKTNNDLVAAGIALMTQATHLLLLTDVDGVYEGTPGAGDPLGELHVDGIHDIKSHASGSGTGGIKSKLRAAENAARNGIETRIGSARDHRAIGALVAGQSVGTLIRAAAKPHSSGSRKWISGGAIARGELSINVEAELSIAAGSSLFASGIKRVKGRFVAGDVVELVSPRGKLLGRGTVGLSSDLLTLIRALKVDDIARVVVQIIRFGADLPADRSGTDARLAAALDQFASLGRDARRRLVVEVTGLFPEDTAAALAGTRIVDPADLVEHYTGLVASLAVIHNSYLVEF